MNPKYLKRIVASYVREKDVPYVCEPIRDAEGLVRQFKYLETRDREEFVALHLDKRNLPLCWDRVSVGSLSETIVCPREVFKTALLSNAAAMIFLHNHPSGRIEPSPEDRLVTSKLVEVAKLLDIKVLDHVIVGESSYFSFREQGLMN